MSNQHSLVRLACFTLIFFGVLTSYASPAFRNALNPPPSDYKGPLFSLRHDYPEQHPTRCDKAECPWLYRDVDFNSASGKWSLAFDAYVADIKAYIEANITMTKTELVLSETWYNLPWLAYNPHKGREYTHGARYSFSIPLKHFFPDFPSNEFVSVWAITQYNRFAAYSIGKMWSKDGELVYQSTDKRKLAGLPFLDGTVILKINLIGHMNKIPRDLKGAPRWTLNLHTENPAGKAHPSLERHLQPAYIFEVDFGVKDSRSPTGWVFGAYVFNPVIPDQANQLHRFELTGIQFGNDPQSFPAVDLAESKPVHQTLLTPFSRHWSVGCQGRMATFIGTPQQGCLSCHQTASFGINAEGLAPRGYDLYYGGDCTNPKDDANKNNRFYFQNAPYGTAYQGRKQVEHPVMVDFSLRSYDAIRAYFQYKHQSQQQRP